MDIYEVSIYGITAAFIGLVLFWYMSKARKLSSVIEEKVNIAKETGRFEPISLFPHIEPTKCIGSGACVSACPEKDVLGLMNARGTLINTTSCIGHGACFEACPVDAISLRIGTEKRGIDLPHVNPDYQTNVPGIFIAGELGGMGLIKNSIEQGIHAINAIKNRLESNTSKHQDEVLDICIVGAGPAGIGAALRATELNMSYTVLEQESLGGTVYTYPRSKLVMTHPVELPIYGSVKLTDTSKDELLTLWNELRSRYKLIIEESTRVDSISNKGGAFMINKGDGTSIRSRNVLLAIGRRGTPRKLNVPGELNQRVAYRLLDEEYITNERILVVGGGDSAVEAALLLKDKNHVILSYRKRAFARIKASNQTCIDKAADSGQINILYNSQVKEILESDVTLNMEDWVQTLKDIDRIYIFAGGELPTQFLKKAGIEMELAKNKILKEH